jgi:hypothetical protein
VYKDIPVQFPKRKCRFHCIPIKIFELYDTNHSILLVYDSLSDKLEIFDPRGSKTPFKHFSDYFGDLIKFVRSLIGIDLSSTIVVPIKNEVQCAIRKSRVRKGIPTWSKHPDEDGKLLEFAKILREEFEPIGYCSAWSIWLLYLRLENPDSDIEELIALANEEIDKFGENPIMWGLVKEGVELARKFETEEMSFEIVHDRSVSHARQTFSLKQSRFIKDKIWPTIFKFDESPYEEEIEVSTIEKF